MPLINDQDKVASHPSFPILILNLHHIPSSCLFGCSLILDFWLTDRTEREKYCSPLRACRFVALLGLIRLPMSDSFSGCEPDVLSLFLDNRLIAIDYVQFKNDWLIITKMQNVKLMAEIMWSPFSDYIIILMF